MTPYDPNPTPPVHPGEHVRVKYRGGATEFGSARSLDWANVAAWEHVNANGWSAFVVGDGPRSLLTPPANLVDVMARVTSPAGSRGAETLEAQHIEDVDWSRVFYWRPARAPYGPRQTEGYVGQPSPGAKVGGPMNDQTTFVHVSTPNGRGDTFRRLWLQDHIGNIVVEGRGGYKIADLEKAGWLFGRWEHRPDPTARPHAGGKVQADEPSAYVKGLLRRRKDRVETMFGGEADGRACIMGVRNALRRLYHNPVPGRPSEALATAISGCNVAWATIVTAMLKVEADELWLHPALARAWTKYRVLTDI